MEDNHIKILSFFEVTTTISITKICASVWDVDDRYVLKSYSDKCVIEKNILLNRLLLAKGVNVAEYVETLNGESYVYFDDKYWGLTKKIKGACIDPYIGCFKQNGIVLGKAVAELHRILKSLEEKTEFCNADFCNEYTSWIVPEFENGSISFKEEILKSLFDFLNDDYKLLPRQLIHRDMHTGNMLFNDGAFYYLDFDMCQRNVRIFDIVYLSSSLLVDSYKDETRLKQWCEIFKGILQGYNELLPLSEIEIKALPPLFVYVELLFTAFYLKRDRKEIAKNCAEMTNWIYRNISVCIA